MMVANTTRVRKRETSGGGAFTKRISPATPSAGAFSMAPKAQTLTASTSTLLTSRPPWPPGDLSNSPRMALPATWPPQRTKGCPTIWTPLDDETKAAGVRILVGGPHLANGEKSLRVRPDGSVLVTDGPYLKTKEHVGSFFDQDEALGWQQGRHRLSGAGRRAPIHGRRTRRAYDSRQCGRKHVFGAITQEKFDWCLVAPILLEIQIPSLVATATGDGIWTFWGGTSKVPIVRLPPCGNGMIDFTHSP